MRWRDAWAGLWDALRPAHLRRCPVSDNTAALGRFGEAAAASFLRTQGMKVLVRRFRSKSGEIDLVCREGKGLVFVEVKARTRADFGRPEEAVERDQERRIVRAAMDYLRLIGDPPVAFRFDIVEVYLEPGAAPRLERVPDVFEIPEPYMY